MLPIKEKSRIAYYTVNWENVNEIRFSHEEPSSFYTDNEVFLSACIHCQKPQCMSYFDGEHESNRFQNYAESKNASVCTLSAIQWDDEGNISINDELCVRCGICASRCPFGAIYYADKRMHVSQVRDSNHFTLIASEEIVSKSQQDCKDHLASVSQVVKPRLRRPFDRVDYVYELLDERKPLNQELLHFCRNLLIEMGFDCALGRTGVVASRMDAVYSGDNYEGPIEIELQDDSLSVTRALLDDLAMMGVRHDLMANQATPLAVFNYLPSTRQGYYQVCDDIENVFGIKVRTISIAALLILMWAKAPIDFYDEMFHLGFRDTSIKDDIEMLLGYRIKENERGGYLEPKK